MRDIEELFDEEMTGPYTYQAILANLVRRAVELENKQKVEEDRVDELERRLEYMYADLHQAQADVEMLTDDIIMLDDRTQPEEEAEPITAEPIQVYDTVGRPSHYNQNKIETIEVIEQITKGYENGYVAHCVGTAIKYLSRAPFKHGEPTEDLSKAAKYLEFALNHLGTDVT